MSLFALMHIAGGVALILFAVRFIRKGLDRLFGARLGRILQRLAGNPIRAWFAGLIVALVTPSSTTVSVLSVQMLDSGYLTPRQMFAVMFGANIGLTILVLLGSLDVQAWAPLLLLVGVAMFQFTQRDLSRGIGQVVLALGFVFLAIMLIGEGAHLSPDGDTARLLAILNRHPVPMAFAATAMAVLIQSSTATILLVVGLSAGGLVDGSVALAGVAGANVGVAVTTLLLGWRSRPARRLAVGNLLVKAVVGVAVVAALGPIAWALARLPMGPAARVGVAHSGFNLVVALLGMPIIPLLDKWTDRWIPASASATRIGPKYLDREPSGSIALSLGQSMREILRVSEIVRHMLDDAWAALEKNDKQLADRVSDRDDEVDLLEREIKRYLTRLAGEGIEGEAAAEQMRQLRFLAELETIGDVVDKSLCDLVVKKTRYHLSFSDAGWNELDRFYRRVRENMTLAEVAFQGRHRGLAQTLLRHKERVNHEHRILRDRHLARLNAGLAQSHESSAIHLDLLTHLKRINSSISHIAYAVLDPMAAVPEHPPNHAPDTEPPAAMPAPTNPPDNKLSPRPNSEPCY